MSGGPQKIVSPQRSRSIKLKVLNKIFPEDFFKRSTSQSPLKEYNPKEKSNQKRRYSKHGADVLESPTKSDLYWEVMREELERCRNLSQKDKIKQIQRTWVYSEKKNRAKPNPEEKLRFESRQSPRKSRAGSEFIESPVMEFSYGLITFSGKSPARGFNLILPPIK